MELNVYDIIKKTVISNKSVELFKKFGHIVFEVNKQANKLEIKNAVEKIWDVKVDKVRVVKKPGKQKVFARRVFKAHDKKKAIVSLKKGYSIDIPGMFETVGAPESMPTTESEGK